MSIFATVGGSFVAELDGAPQSLVGTVQVGIFNEPAGTAVVAYTTAGITEEVSGASTSTYYAALTAPGSQPASGQKYVVKWKNGSTIVTEDLVLSSLLSSVLAPSGPTAGVSFGSLVADYIQMSGVSDARARARLNMAYRRFAAKSEAIRAKLGLGTTVANQGEYDLDPAIIGVYDPVRIAGKRLERKSAEDIDDINAGQAFTVGRTNGYYAPDFDAMGGGKLLISTPTTGGDAITARVSLYPADLVGDGEYPLLPAHYHDLLPDGALAIGLSRDDERFTEGQALLAQFDQEAVNAKSQLNRRVGSGGVAHIKLVTR